MIRKFVISNLIVVSLISASSLALAKGERMDDFLTLELGLDETRAAQVKQVFEVARDEAMEIKKEHFEKMDAHREATKEKLAEILSPEEMEKFESKKERKMKKMRFHENRFERGE